MSSECLAMAASRLFPRTEALRSVCDVSQSLDSFDYSDCWTRLRRCNETDGKPPICPPVSVAHQVGHALGLIFTRRRRTGGRLFAAIKSVEQTTPSPTQIQCPVGARH